MKHLFSKRLIIASLAFISIPATMMAQKEEKDKSDKKEFQQITITRNGDKNEKTIIEIDGDKVKINGKDADENKDVHVNIRDMKRSDNARFRDYSGNNDMMDMHMNLFSEDQNRAMLGVVTEGNDKGAEIQTVTKGSAAEKAGLKKGDIIIRIGDKKVETTDDVTDIIHAHKPGEKVTVTILRKDKEEKLTAELGKWKGIDMNNINIPDIQTFNLDNGGTWNVKPMTPMPPMQNFGNNFSYNIGRPKLGLSIQDTEDGNGVKVLDVEDESNAEKAGIKEGDIITAIDGKAVKGTEDLTKVLHENHDKYTFSFTINREGKTQTIEVKMPRKLKTADL